MILVVLAMLQAPARDDRKPIPEVAAQKQAEALIRDLFKEEYGKKAPVDRLALAQKLLEQSSGAADDPASFYVLLREARDLAVQAGNADVAWEAVERLAKAFRIDAIAWKLNMLTLLERTAGAGDLPKILDAYLKLSEQAAGADDLGDADKAVSAALSVAKRLKELQLINQVEGKKKEIEELKRRFRRVQKARAALQSAEDDAGANQTVGEYECFAKGNWSEGLAYLAKGTDPLLKEAAAMDLATPDDPQKMVEIAERWWDLGEKEKGVIKGNLRKRAVRWYESAQDRLTGLKKVIASKRIDEARTQIVGLKNQKVIFLGKAKQVKLDLVWIRPGKFIMGSPASESGRKDDETQHQVAVTKGFWMGTTKVTQTQWEAVTGSNPSHFLGDGNLPVENVSWHDCQDVLRILGEMCKDQLGGLRADLPTEAEWEYACRAGSTTRWYFGEDESKLVEHAWYKANSGDQTHPVGQKKPNAWGLYDMYGNVAEWCKDGYGPYTGDAANPVGEGAEKVLRCGSMMREEWYMRSAHRGREDPSKRFINVGVRVVVR